MADFNFYLNRQGVQGRKGDQGEQGFSPVISVNSETANEYTLRIQNEDYEIITPNLRGNHIEYTGGTYIRINPETEQLYTGLIDQATTSTYGGVILAADGALELGTDYNGVVSAGDIHDYVEAKIGEAGLNFDDLTNSLVAGNNITLVVDDTNETITINSASSNYTAGSNINITNNVISAENVVTTNTTQTINLFEGNNRIFKTFRESGLTSSVGDSCIRFYNSDNGVNHIISIGQNGYGGVSRGGIVAKGGSGALLGTSGADSSCIFLSPSSSNPVIIKGKPEPFSSSDLDSSYPIWNESIVSAGNGVSITTTGAGANKTYTISATGGDLSNYVTLDTQQYITGEKNFNRNLPSSGTTNVCLRAGSTSALITHNMTMAINSAGVPVLSTNGAHCGTYIGNANGYPICFLKRPDSVGYGMPSVCIQYESQLAPNEYTQSNTYPLFNALNFTAGSGVTITPTGTGAGTTYEISTTGTITVDSALSLTSTNPVQNAVITQALDDINDVIPAQASSSNQLADKNFVNSSIATNTANFIGTFSSLADLEAYTGTVTNNDYAFVTTTDAQGNTIYNRYKYNTDTQTWIFEYALNNTGFTAAQMAAINSGATSTNIGQISTNTSDIGAIQTTLSGFGNIVTHNVNEFATASQGSLANTALQPNDNISKLINDSGYITSASLPTVDQTYDSTSTNAQSGVAIANVGFLTSVPTATLSSLGAVQPDGTTIDINNGIISAIAQTPSIIDGGEETVV